MATIARASRISAFRASKSAKPLSRRIAVAVAASKKPETRLNASLLPLLALPGAEAARQALTPSAEYFKTLGLPEALIHWGHPGNMAVVLFAMGFYGAGYLGWQIRTASDAEVVAKARDSHPKIAAGMAIFFALGAVGGTMSLIMQGKSVFESSHAMTGFIGLGLLGLQAVLPAAFSSNKQARTAHAFLGSGILALFLVHAALGLQLGLSI